MADIFHRLAIQYTSPLEVQKFINTLKYNSEKDGETLCSALISLKKRKVHCLEAAFVAAAILERHEHPPLVLSMESKDYLDHVVYVFCQNGKWGSIGRSRDRGLQGRAPVFRSLRDLTYSYFEPYIDQSGRIKSYEVFHLDEVKADWRKGTNNLWQIEQYLGSQKHRKLKTSDKKYRKLHKLYLKKVLLPTAPYWW